jgi:cell envelope opacity-associated protein A
MRTALLPVVVAVVGLGAAGLAALPSQAPETGGDMVAARATETTVAVAADPDGSRTIPLPLPKPATRGPEETAKAETLVATAPPAIRATGRMAPEPETAPPAGTAAVPAPGPGTAGNDGNPPEVPPGQLVTLKVRSGDSLDKLFRRNDISTLDLAYIMKLDEAARHLKTIRPGDRIDVRHADGEVIELSRAIGDL